MRIGILVQKNPSLYDQEAIQSIIARAPLHGHSVEVHLDNDRSWYYMLGIPKSSRRMHETSQQRMDAIASMDAIISFSISDTKCVSAIWPLTPLVAIVHQRRDAELLTGAVRGIWTDPRLALSLALNSACLTLAEGEIVGHVTNQPTSSQKTIAPGEIVPISITGKRSGKGMRPKRLKIRDIEYRHKTMAKSSITDLATVICDNTISAANIRSIAERKWGKHNATFVGYDHCVRSFVEVGNISHSKMTIADYRIEEVTYQALLACELPQPAQPEIIHIEPRFYDTKSAARTPP